MNPFGHALNRRSLWIAHVLEPVILLLVAALCLVLPVKNVAFLSPFPDLLPAEVGVIVALAGAVLTVVPLLAARYVRWRAVWILITVALVVGGVTWFIMMFEVPKLVQLRRDDELGLMNHQWLLPLAVSIVRVFVWISLTFLIAVYFVRRSFAWPIFIIGSVAAGYAVGWILTPFWSSPGAWRVPWAFTIFNSAILALPMQRRSLERHFKVSLSPGTENSNIARPFLETVLAHGVVVAIAIAAAFSGFVNYFERCQLDRIKGALPEWRSPALHNAYDNLKQHFTASSGHSLAEVTSVPESLRISYENFDSVSSSAALNEARTIVSNVAPYLREFETAAQADYIELPASPEPSWKSFLVAGRLIGIRAQLALRDGQTSAALQDVKTLILMGNLMSDESILISQLLGARLRNHGVHAARQCLVRMSANAADLETLARLLQELSSRTRVGLKVAPLLRREVGLSLPVLPNAVLVRPSVAISIRRMAAPWINFDLLQVATALEQYRLHGGQYPAALTALSPTYLNAIPRDPITGGSYEYHRVSADDYVLTSPQIMDKWKQDDGERLLSFPVKRTSMQSSAEGVHR